MNEIKELGVGYAHLMFGYEDMDGDLAEPLHNQGFNLMRVVRALPRNATDYFNEHPELKGEYRYPEYGEIIIGADVAPEDLTADNYVWAYNRVQEEALQYELFKYISFGQEPDGYIDPETHEIYWTTVTCLPPEQQKNYTPTFINTAEDFALSLRVFYKAYKSVNPEVFVGLGETGAIGAAAYRFKGDYADLSGLKEYESLKKYDGFYIRVIKELQRLEKIEKDPRLIKEYLKEHPDISEEEAKLIFSPDKIERYFDAAGLDIGQGPAWREPLYIYDPFLEANAPRTIRDRVERTKNALERLGYSDVPLVNEEGEHPNYNNTTEEKETYARIVVKKYVVGIAHGMSLIFQDNPNNPAMSQYNPNGPFIYHTYRQMTKKLQGLKPRQIAVIQEDQGGFFAYRFETDKTSGFVVWRHPLLQEQENKIILNVSEGVKKVIVSHSVPLSVTLGLGGDIGSAEFTEYTLPVTDGKLTIDDVYLEPLYITEVK